MTLPEQYEDHKVYGRWDQLLYMQAPKGDVLKIFDINSKKILYGNDNFSAQPDLNIPGTHYYLSNSADVVNAASSLLGSIPLHDQPSD